MSSAVAAKRTELALLQHAQQFDLEGRAGFANFVEEQRAAVILLEQAFAVSTAPVKAPRLAEEFVRAGVGQAPQFSVMKGLSARRLW